MTVPGNASVMAFLGIGTLVLLGYYVTSGRLAFQDCAESVTGFGRSRRTRLLLVARVLELIYCCYITCLHLALNSWEPLEAYTFWSWLVLTAYIALATAVSCSYAVKGTVCSLARFSAPSLVHILADVSLGNALFIDLAYWLVLQRGQTPAPEDFAFSGWLSGQLHSLNFAVALVDRALSCIRHSDYHFPFLICFQFSYTVFSLIYWHITGKVAYFFLDPEVPLSEVWLLAGFVLNVLVHFIVGHICNACFPDFSGLDSGPAPHDGVDASNS